MYNGEYPFFQTGDVKAANLHLTKYSQTYNEEGLAQSRLWEPGVLMVTIAANIAETAILGVRGCFPDSIVGFTPHKDKCDVYFAKYFIDYFKLRMQSISGGAAQDNLSVEKILTFDFDFPDLETQHKVSFILKSMDILIENNFQRIEILEEMAQLIYREWFVNLRFPGHEKVKFVNSEMGKIPKGWEVKKFIEAFNIEYGKTLPKKKISDFGAYPVYGAGDVIGYYDQKIVDEKVTLITCRGNGSGTVWRTQEPAFVTNNSLMITPRAGYNYLSFGLIMNIALNSDIRSAIGGSAQPQITIDSLSNVLALIPGNEVATTYSQLSNSFYELVDKLHKKKSVLQKIRDLLLPKLISGQLDVSELDIVMPEDKESAAS